MREITLATVPRENDRKITIPAWFGIELALQLYHSDIALPPHSIKRWCQTLERLGTDEERQKLMKMIKGTRFDPEIPENVRKQNATKS